MTWYDFCLNSTFLNSRTLYYYWMSTIILTPVKPGNIAFFCITSIISNSTGLPYYLLPLYYYFIIFCMQKSLRKRRLLYCEKSAYFYHHTIYLLFDDDFYPAAFLRALPWSNQGWRKGNLGPKGPSSFLRLLFTATPKTKYCIVVTGGWV